LRTARWWIFTTPIRVFDGSPLCSTRHTPNMNCSIRERNWTLVSVRRCQQQRVSRPRQVSIASPRNHPNLTVGYQGPIRQHRPEDSTHPWPRNASRFRPFGESSESPERVSVIQSEPAARLSKALLADLDTPTFARRARRCSTVTFRRRLLFRVHPTRSAPCHFIASVLPTKHLFDHGKP
jgi:hypothetical protein